MATLSSNVQIGPVTIGAFEISCAAGGTFTVPDDMVEEVTAILQRRPGVTITTLSYSDQFDVTRYGAKGDGVTDDQPAIQAAIDAAEAAGGGTVFLPPGTYRLTTVIDNPGTTQDTHLRISGSGVRLRGTGPSSVLKSTVAVPMFGIGQLEFELVGATVRAVTASVAAGVRSITLATPSQASIFAAGDHVLIRTGQTLDGFTNQPDAEINRIVSADSSTGVLTLSWPTAKPYAQEYFISGTTGKTSTTVTANPALYGVANIDSLVITDIAFEDFALDHSGFQHVFIGGGIVGFTVRNLTGTLAGGLQSMGNYRFGQVSGCRIHHTGTGAVTYTLTTATATSDVTWTDNIITGERIIQFHIHEGSSRVIVANNQLLTGSSASDEFQISVRARAYGISIVGNIIDGTSGSYAILVDEDCTGGGLIAQNTILSDSPVSIATSAPNWIVVQNRTPNADQATYSRYLGNDTESHTLSGWLTTTQQTTILGYLPSNSFIIGIALFAYDAFNSSGTDLVSIGTDAFNDLYGAPTDVSTVGYKTLGAGQWGLGFGYDGGSRTVKAYYVNGGTEPTAGKVIAILTYARVAALP